VILLYLESFGNPQKFARLARRIGRHKPIVALKSGRTRAGSRAAGSHTAALAASDAVVDELFRATGVIRANTIDEMFDLASCLSAQPLPRGRRVGIVTNAGGPGILAVDACEGAGLDVAEFSDRTRAQLSEFLSASASLGNPVDMVASAGSDAYRRAITVALAADEVDALIIIYTPVDPGQSAQVMVGIAAGIAESRRTSQKPVLACLMADAARPKPLTVGGERIPAYAFPENAARALACAVKYAEWRESDPGVVPSLPGIRSQAARDVFQRALDTRGDSWLTADEVRTVLDAYSLPLLNTCITRSPDEAAAAATTLGFPVVAKINAAGLLHKSDVGGVRTSLRSADDVRTASRELLDIARGLGFADATILLQRMVSDGVETMIGVTYDSSFGPLVGFGLGGVDVELEQDVHFRASPLTDRDAAAMIAESRAWRRLQGSRGRPAGDVPALTDILLRVSQLASDQPLLLELDLNPVLARARGQGCAVLDARVRVGHRMTKVPFVRSSWRNS